MICSQEIRAQRTGNRLKKKMLCVGEMMADLVAFPIEKVLLESDYHPMDSFWVKTGGDAHNNAVDLARLGNDVIYIGRDRKSTRLNSSHWNKSRMPSSA